MVKVFIVEDHSVVVEGILALLQNEKEITMVGHASNANDCINYCKSNAADVILMDINLPDMSGIDLCKLIKTSHPQINILALSTFNQGSYMSKIMEHGASGYLLKNVGKGELVEAIKAASRGEEYFSFEAGKTYKATLEKQNQIPVLTKREKEILKLIVDGLTNFEISKQLFISNDTVDTHRKNLYQKLNVKNTALLIRCVLENNLV